MPRFDFCLTPRPVAAKASQAGAAPGLCGRPICSAIDQEVEVNVTRLPKCVHCNASEPEPLDIEFSLVPEPMPNNAILQRNLHLAKSVVRDVFNELEAQCAEEQRQYEETSTVASKQKRNVWATYTNKARLQRFMADSLDFVRCNAECRTRPLTSSQVRFLVLLQHFVSEDTNDFYRPEPQRKHQDAFEGVSTDGVNSQLVKDAHRSEFSVDGRSFSFHDMNQQELEGEERSAAVARFQTEFVTALESYLLAFCSRRGVSTQGTRKLLQAVTTQMSQAGLANLDRGSQATRYFVGSQGLEQRTVYNLSAMHSTDLGEVLKLSILCMKTGFSQYLEKDELLRRPGVDRPKRCKPSSYLYQYATLRFALGPYIDNCESIVCTVLDTLDEAHIDLPGG
jgi:hypothetical protein